MPIPIRKAIKLDLLGLLSKHDAVDSETAYEILARQWSLTGAEREEKRGRDARYRYEIRWARQELVIEGIVTRPKESGLGRWSLVVREFRNEGFLAEEIETRDRYSEGSIETLVVNRYERNRAARTRCLEIHGFLCAACGFDFFSRYGVVGKNCIHVHHLVPLSSIGNGYLLDPTTDLIPVCPNCHYMLHRREPPFTIQEMRNILKSNLLPTLK